MNTNDPDDPVAVYIREISNVEALTKDDETKLFRELRSRGNWDEGHEHVARRLLESKLASITTSALSSKK